MNNKAPEKAVESLYKRIPKTDKFAFFSGAFICLLVNMFVYTNTCFVHDSIGLYSSINGLINGRLLIEPLFAVLNRMQMPWVIGALLCVITGFLTVYLARIFEIKSKLNTVILAGIVITGDTMVILHAYFFSSYIYAFALLLAVIAVYCTDRFKYGQIVAVLLLCVSMMMYQAYLSVAVCLYVFKLIFDLKNDRTNKERLLKIIKYVSIAVISAALYYAIWKAALKLSDTEMLKGYTYDSMGIGGSFSEFASRIVEAFRLTFVLFFPINSIADSYALRFIISALAVISFIAFAFLQTTVTKILYYFLYSITFIFSVNLMYFLSGSVSYELTTFSYIFPMLGLLYLIDNRTEFPKLKLQKQLAWCTCILCVILIAGQSVYANSLYLKMKVNYDNAWSYATRIVDRLEQTEGFSKDTRVVIAGYNHYNGGSTQNNIEYPQNQDIVEAVNYTSGYKDYNALYTYPSAVTYPKTLEWFITQEMDMAIDIEGNAEEFRNDKRVDEMPVFPSEGSVQWLDGTLVVKIGEMPKE